MLKFAVLTEKKGEHVEVRRCYILDWGFIDDTFRCSLVCGRHLDESCRVPGHSVDEYETIGQEAMYVDIGTIRTTSRILYLQCSSMRRS